MPSTADEIRKRFEGATSTEFPSSKPPESFKIPWVPLDWSEIKLEGPYKSPNTTDMNGPTREELNAKLETIEAKMDGRISRIEDSIANLVKSNEATSSQIGSLKTTLIVTAIGSVIAIVGGVAAFNATLLGNMVSAMGAGKELGATLEASRAQAASAQQLLEQIRSEREVQAKTPPRIGS